jgi:hypothetical protein
MVQFLSESQNTRTIMTRITGSDELKNAAKKHNINFAVLIAEVAIWVNPQVHLD